MNSYVIVIWMSAIPFIVAIIWFVYNAIYSVAFTAKTFTAAKCQDLARGATSRSQRLAALPIQIAPVVKYDRRHGRTERDAIPVDQADRILDSFERRLFDSEDRRLFFARFRPTPNIDEECTSIMILNQATPLLRFTGWITLVRTGNQIEWHLNCSEIRFWKTPAEEASHFAYDRLQEHRIKYQIDHMIGDRFYEGVWNIVSLNFTTQTNAHRAEWFERYLTEMWLLTLDEAISHQTWDVPSNVTPAINPSNNQVSQISPNASISTHAADMKADAKPSEQVNVLRRRQ